MKEKVLIRSLPCLHLPNSGKQILTVFYLLFINNDIINQRICRSVRHSILSLTSDLLHTTKMNFKVYEQLLYCDY